MARHRLNGYHPFCLFVDLFVCLFSFVCLFACLFSLVFVCLFFVCLLSSQGTL